MKFFLLKWIFKIALIFPGLFVCLVKISARFLKGKSYSIAQITIAKLYHHKKAYRETGQHLLLAFQQFEASQYWFSIGMRCFLKTLAKTDDSNLAAELMKLHWPRVFLLDEVVFAELAALYEKHPEIHDIFFRDIEFKHFYRSLSIVPVQDRAIRTLFLKDASTYSFENPRVFEDLSSRPKYTVPVPACKIWECKDVQLAGAFQVVTYTEFLMTDEAARPRNELVAGVWRYFSACRNGENTCYIKNTADPTKVLKVKSAILFSGRAPENYYHWLIEDISKLMSLDMVKLPRTIPILVKRDLPYQFMEALKIFTSREVILVDPGEENISIQRLFVLGPSTYHPEIYNFEFWRGGALSKPHLQFLRNRVFGYFGIQEGKVGEGKIYISRPSGGRRSIVNNQQIEQLFEDRGFEIVRPENLSFEQQVRLFSSAKIIAGGAGAAYANLIFCQPGCEVLGLVCTAIKTYSMQANLAKFGGARYTLITGEPFKRHSQQAWFVDEVHQDFWIDPEQVQRFLQEQGIK
jgi:capsular polysaccharide biosynthesis protein